MAACWDLRQLGANIIAYQFLSGLHKKKLKYMPVGHLGVFSVKQPHFSLMLDSRIASMKDLEREGALGEAPWLLLLAQRTTCRPG